MTDRIRSEFEKWATGREFPDLTQSMGRYNRAVVRWMWEAWQEQAERVADVAAALERAHNRQTGLLKQCRDHDTRRAAAVVQSAALAEELEAIREDNHSMMTEIHNLRIVIGQLTAESTDAEEM